MITCLQSFTMKPSPVSPPVRVLECILTTHWAGASELTASAPGYSWDSTSYVEGEILRVGWSTHCFFYPAVLESIIRHGGHHSLVWKPACIPEIQDKPSAVDSSEGWRRPTALYTPSGTLGGVAGQPRSEISPLTSHLNISYSPQHAFQFSQIQVRLLKTLVVLVSITVVNAEGDM